MTEDEKRIQAIMRLTYTVMQRMVKEYTNPDLVFEDLPEAWKNLVVAQLHDINAYTLLVKPYAYEWGHTDKETAMLEWMASDLRSLFE